MESSLAASRSTFGVDVRCAGRECGAISGANLEERASVIATLRRLFQLNHQSVYL
jgi:hypothetical protein